MTRQDVELPCIACGTVLDRVFDDPFMPSDGTQFTTYGHYGSTFWDSFDGEELVLIVCDDCLKAHTDRLARHKRYRKLVVDTPTSNGRFAPMIVGRAWLDRETLPYFDGPEDHDELEIGIEEIGSETLPGRNEWASNWREIKANLVRAWAEWDKAAAAAAAETGVGTDDTHGDINGGLT